MPLCAGRTELECGCVALFGLTLFKSVSGFKHQGSSETRLIMGSAVASLKASLAALYIPRPNPSFMKAPYYQAKSCRRQDRQLIGPVVDFFFLNGVYGFRA